jgi:phosphopantetheinyl transferase (holo-ACP synthase)
MSKGERNAAEDCFIRAIQISRRNESSRKMLAVMYLKEADYEKALMVMLGAAENGTRDPFFWKNIGVLQKYYKANQVEAKKAFNRYFALGGDSHEKRVRREM